ncbi:hypothetical protein HRJ34_15440 [Rhizorhabdus wittichii]|uniref:Uncharacterized protein n=1 Tax=Rhizorhabdus wittichii TaxID=160791 RepID=A0A975CYV6_9SPHN|nr:hypothetical protein [Rhizorhabdus wittichii]QTH19761.1 hypothetical protein HRJ34_15440 [Rhizorhabdus wittichii]
MEPIVGKTYEGGTVEIDGKSFVSVVFKGTTIDFAGLAAPHFHGCSFHDVRWKFSGAAQLTVELLQAFQEAGNQALIDALFPPPKKRRLPTRR